MTDLNFGLFELLEV